MRPLSRAGTNSGIGSRDRKGGRGCSLMDDGERNGDGWLVGCGHGLVGLRTYLKHPKGKRFCVGLIPTSNFHASSFLNIVPVSWPRCMSFCLSK